MATHGYNHGDIEKAAQEKWAALDLYTTDLSDPSKEPYYLLVEFPYPSGDLHIGHWYAFAVTDIFARFKRAQGKNVLFPIGFDAFGLPAENAAIQNGADPNAWTEQNMDRMRVQLRTMGASFDWSKEIVTCHPDYYLWTQWLFTKFFEQGLAERKKASVKWCPKDQTVLANEQVIDGHCERCGSEVEEKMLTQWFMKITEYAERLLDDLEQLPWREDIKEAQRAWIGKSEGAKLTFPIVGRDESIEVFTTRPDTLYGATYVVLAPEHPLVSIFLPALSNAPDVEAYRTATTKKTERERSENKEKTGVKLEGIMAVNPASKEEIPVYVADYVLASYGTGAVMAVPAHDERDFEFAKKMDLPIKFVFDSGAEPPNTGDGILENSGDFTGRYSKEARWEVAEAVGGERTTQFRLRDWLVSRQRYWGCPIPIVYDPDGKPHPIPQEHLPWLLPTDVSFTSQGDEAGPEKSKAPLGSSKELQERVERLFGQGWTPEYDTLDTFVDSSWYYLRYLDPKDEHDFSDRGLMRNWLPVNRYSGGSEHTTMHLLYARFLHKALYDLALVPTSEPFNERFNRGLILGTDGQKMSKRWGNVVNPDDMVARYGADAVRVYLAFIGPYNEPGQYPWKLDGVEAMRRFLDRVAALLERVAPVDETQEVARAVARATVKAGNDSERFKFNTAVSALMVLLKELEALSEVPRTTYHDFLTLLAPFAPHLAEYLFEQTEGEGSIHQRAWPVANEALLVEEEVSVVVQVAGKRRGELRLAPDATQEEALAAALLLPAVAGALGGGAPSRVVYVPGKILNLVP